MEQQLFKYTVVWLVSRTNSEKETTKTAKVNIWRQELGHRRKAEVGEADVRFFHIILKL